MVKSLLKVSFSFKLEWRQSGQRAEKWAAPSSQPSGGEQNSQVTCLVINVWERWELSGDIMEARKGFCNLYASRSEAGSHLWVDGLLSDLHVKCNPFMANTMRRQHHSALSFFFSDLRVPDLGLKTLETMDLAPCPFLSLTQGSWVFSERSPAGRGWKQAYPPSTEFWGMPSSAGGQCLGPAEHGMIVLTCIKAL